MAYQSLNFESSCGTLFGILCSMWPIGLFFYLMHRLSSYCTKFHVCSPFHGNFSKCGRKIKNIAAVAIRRFKSLWVQLKQSAQIQVESNHCKSKAKYKSNQSHVSNWSLFNGETKPLTPTHCLPSFDYRILYILTFVFLSLDVGRIWCECLGHKARDASITQWNLKCFSRPFLEHWKDLPKQFERLCQNS